MCTTAFITAVDLLPTMTTVLRQNQLAQALKCVDPRQQPSPVCGDGGGNGDKRLEVSVHPMVHRNGATQRFGITLRKPEIHVDKSYISCCG
jgi:hypothetical protein